MAAPGIFRERNKMTPSRAMFWDRILPLSVSNQTLGRTSLPQRLAGAHLVEQLVVAYQGPGRCLFGVHHSLAAARAPQSQFNTSNSGQSGVPRRPDKVGSAPADCQLRGRRVADRKNTSPVVNLYGCSEKICEVGHSGKRRGGPGSKYIYFRNLW